MSARSYEITGTWHTRNFVTTNESTWDKPLIKWVWLRYFNELWYCKIPNISVCGCIPIVKNETCTSKGVLIHMDLSVLCNKLVY